MTSPKKGFMKLARGIIQDHPHGLTRAEVVEKALALDPYLSNAKNPEHSLGATLAKQVGGGMEPDIEARGRWPARYYPKDNGLSAPLNDTSQHLNSGFGERVENPTVITLIAGDSQFKGPATPENIQLIRQWLDELEKSKG